MNELGTDLNSPPKSGKLHPFQAPTIAQNPKSHLKTQTTVFK
jgi:hypothetical protein